jgi:enoyl-CoA hydratase/carnithine racemase
MTTMSPSPVQVSTADGVTTIAMDDPDRRNALSDEMLGGLIDAFESARDDTGTRCVVLASTHEKVWCAGGNLAGFGSEEPTIEKYLGAARFPRLFTLMAELGKPTICAANGFVLAGGFGLALACDLIVAKESAKFGTPEINVGLFPYMISALIYRNVPRKKADEMMLLGNRYSAEEGREIGFVNRVVPDAEFDAAVTEWATQLASKSPLLMRLGKDAATRMRDMPLGDALAYLQAQLTLTLTTEDAREGVSAFFEKRDPEWKNR